MAPIRLPMTTPQFFAGWIALSKLKNAALAETHFARLQAGATTPITMSRAYYWRGRAAQAKGDMMDASLFWSDGAKYYTAFYGQLSAAKLGQKTFQLAHDPVATAADRARFESRGVIKAARLLGDAGDQALLASCVMAAEGDIACTPTPRCRCGWCARPRPAASSCPTGAIRCG